MNIYTFIVSVVLLWQLPVSILLAQNQPGNITREINKKGWEVPGILDLNHVKGDDLKEEIIEGIPVQVSDIAPTNPTRFDYTHEIANRIRRYAINGKPFCYYAALSTYIFDKASGAGSVPGIQYYRAYYDEDGDGIFEIIEYSRLSNIWHPHVPDWAKNASKKQ
jgi:hypothetical protein